MRGGRAGRGGGAGGSTGRAERANESASLTRETKANAKLIDEQAKARQAQEAAQASGNKR